MESLSLSKRWDVINHYSIAFKRVNEWRMHLTLEEMVGVNILTSFTHTFVSDCRKFQCIGSKKWLAMASLNVNGLRNDLDEVKVLINDMRIDFLAQNETQLDSSFKS